MNVIPVLSGLKDEISDDYPNTKEPFVKLGERTVRGIRCVVGDAPFKRPVIVITELRDFYKGRP